MNLNKNRSFKIVLIGAFFLFFAMLPAHANTSLFTDANANLIPSEGFSFMSFLRGMIGLFSIFGIAYLFSSNRKAIRWDTVGTGLLIQLVLALGVLYVPFVRDIFESLGKVFVLILNFTKAGSEFLLGDLVNLDKTGYVFAFQILPTIIFFSALTSVLFYLGVIQTVVKWLAWGMTKLMKISGTESLSVAGNIFLGQTESPLMIKAYLEKMNKSELFLVMTGGMATIAGGVMAAYIGFLGGSNQALQVEFAKHLLTASVMAAPGAIIISKMLIPQTEEINHEITITKDKAGSNILDAISNGTYEGLKLALNVGGMLLVFIAFIAMLNYITDDFIGSKTGLNTWVANISHGQYNGFSLQFILGYLLSPLMWLIGVNGQDITAVGQLLGEKVIINEFIGYKSLATLQEAGKFTYEKSIIMATYILCGFANFSSIGIQIGGIGSLAPGKRKLLSEMGLKALLAGTLASLLSATILGMIMG